MKLKTHSGTKKRVKVTGRGKLMLSKAARQHRLRGKSKRQKKLNRLGSQVSGTDLHNLEKLIPWS